MNTLPSSLQGVLWSRRVSSLNPTQDAPYIIHQILALGTLEELRWLFDTYGIASIRQVFLEKPMKIYSPQALSFVQTILDVSESSPEQYDRTLPRHIG